MIEEFKKLKEGSQEFHNLTFFPANYLRCSISTRERLSSLINDDGIIDGLGLQVFIDLLLHDDEVIIGMKSCPSVVQVIL